MTPSLLLYYVPRRRDYSFVEQMEVRRSHIKRILGMRKDFKSTFSRSSHGNLRSVDRVVVLQVWYLIVFMPDLCHLSYFAKSEQCKSDVLASFLRFPGIFAQFARVMCSVYRADLLKIINHDHHLIIPKD